MNEKASKWDAVANAVKALFEMASADQFSALVAVIVISIVVWGVKSQRLKGLLSISGLLFAYSFLVETEVKTNILQLSGLLVALAGAYHTYMIPAKNKRVSNSKKRTKISKSVGIDRVKTKAKKVES